MKLAGKTDVGRVRQDNQDDYRAGELPGDAAWALVCDGMGGARAGGKPRSVRAASSSAAFRSSTTSASPAKRRLF